MNPDAPNREPPLDGTGQPTHEGGSPSPPWTPPPQQQGWRPPQQQGWAAPEPQGWTPQQQHARSEQQAWIPPPHEAWTPPDHTWQQPPPRRGGRAAVVVIALLVIVLVVAIGAFVYMLASGLGGALGGRTPIGQVAVGQCFDGMTAGSGDSTDPTSQLALVFGVLVVDCGVPHDAELVGRFDWTAGDGYPGETQAARFSEQECRRLFADYVGTDFDLSVLELTYTYPVEAQWRSGVRTFECVVVAPAGDEKLIGSVRGTRR